MKKSLFSVVLTMSVLFPMTAIHAETPPEVPMTGAYGDSNTNSEQIKKAAEFAVKAQGEKQKRPIKLVKIISAETQVVAGLNYRMTLRVKPRYRLARNVNVVVYQKLDQSYGLTSWESAK